MIYLTRDSDSTVPRDTKQIKNYKCKYASKEVKEVDETVSLLSYLLEQPHGKNMDPLSDDQSFLQEVLFRNGKQPSYVLYTEQSLRDMERFCTNSSAPTSFRSVVAVDTTFNIASHYFTQTTYRNLSLLKKDTVTWFPGPIFVHRHQEKIDFSYFWQAVKRGNTSLDDIAIIGTDECDELFDGILNENQQNTGHLLGKEHVLKNVQKKLEKLRFPRQQSKWICGDIFGDPLDQAKKILDGL